MNTAANSPNGNRPRSLLAGTAPNAGLIARVMSWVDVAVAHLLSDRQHRALIQRSREFDDRLERVARRLTRRQRTRRTE
jgi:hypothetical protein